MITGITRSIQWKSVEDGLPPLNTRALIARVKDAGPHGKTYCSDCGTRTADGWRSDAEGDVQDVTHWAPMPETPIPAIMRGVLHTLRHGQTAV